LKQSAADRDRLAKDYATRAVELLNKLRESKFFQDKAKLDEFRTNPDLNALRGRPEFVSVLRQIEERNQASKK
jgi:hypothetical protein